MWIRPDWEGLDHSESLTRGLSQEQAPPTPPQGNHSRLILALLELGRQRTRTPHVWLPLLHILSVKLLRVAVVLSLCRCFTFHYTNDHNSSFYCWWPVGCFQGRAIMNKSFLFNINILKGQRKPFLSSLSKGDSELCGRSFLPILSVPGVVSKAPPRP